VERLTTTATPDDGGLEPVAAETAAACTYTIESVPPGPYTVTVTVGEGQSTSPSAVAVEIEEDEEEADVDFEVIAAGS
jgi:N-methylhydantoinase B/oxoprolinase/acetone carboxylase alpha subunit